MGIQIFQRNGRAGHSNEFLLSDSPLADEASYFDNTHSI